MIDHDMIIVKIIDSHYETLHYACTCIAPGIVQNLVCTPSSSPSVLSFSWDDPPTLLDSEVVSYQVRVNRLEHRPGTREVIQSDVYENFVDTRETSVTGLGKEILIRYCMTLYHLN
jgi:hypothetical protein